MNCQKVHEYIESNRENIVKYLSDMISFPSINHTQEGGNEKDVQDWLEASLKGFDFDVVDKFAVDPDGVRPNVCAKIKGTGGGKSLLFNGHMDVVPVGKPEIWCCDPFKPVVKDGKVFGRGSSDMKGGITAAIWALKALKDCGVKLRGDVILQAATGEESQQAEDIGTVKCLERGYTADFAIVCEPTDMEIHITSSALFFFELQIEGKAVHTSARNQAVFPQPYGVPSGKDVAVDAFKKSLIFVDYFYRLEEELNHRYRDPVLGAGGNPRRDKQGIGIFTINPSDIKGGVYLGSVPSYVRYMYCVWYPDQLVKKEVLFEEIKAGVAALASTDEFLRETPPKLTIPTLQNWSGFKVDRDHPGVQTLASAVQNVSGSEAVISGFRAVCDVSYINEYGIPCIIYGPGSLANAVHGDDEFIAVEEVIEAAKVYAQMIMQWCE